MTNKAVRILKFFPNLGNDYQRWCFVKHVIGVCGYFLEKKIIRSFQMSGL